MDDIICEEHNYWESKHVEDQFARNKDYSDSLPAGLRGIRYKQTNCHNGSWKDNCVWRSSKIPKHPCQHGGTVTSYFWDYMVYAYGNFWNVNERAYKNRDPWGYGIDDDNENEEPHICDLDLHCCFKCPACALHEIDTRRRHEFRVKNPYWLEDVVEILIRKYTAENPGFLLKIYPSDKAVRRYVMVETDYMDRDF